MWPNNCHNCAAYPFHAKFRLDACLQCRHFPRSSRCPVPLRHPRHAHPTGHDLPLGAHQTAPLPIHFIQLALHTEFRTPFRRDLHYDFHFGAHDALRRLNKRKDLDADILPDCDGANRLIS